jgi:hypothetical protein
LGFATGLALSGLCVADDNPCAKGYFVLLAV